MADWKDKQVTVLGLGKSGISAAKYLAKKGARVLISDANAAVDNQQIEELNQLGVRVETGGHTEQAISGADLIVTSPGIAPSCDVIQKAKKLGKEIICDIEIAYKEATMPIIAITGTNGKSTTCALISHLLEQAGYKAPACGNFGVPILDELLKQPDYLVVEVSSFQLNYSPTFSPVVAVWLNLTADHLDWHGGLPEYIQAKQSMFLRQRSNQYAVINHDDKTVSSSKFNGQIFPFSVKEELEHSVQGAFLKKGFIAYRIDGNTQIVCRSDELKIRGKHNLENALAAVAVAAVLRLNLDAITEHIKSFTALEHRLEYVDTINGIEFYNDSKATNTDSAIKALESFPDQKIVLIAGGRDKGTPLEEFVEIIKERVEAVLLLGEAKDRFAKALKDGKFQNVYMVSDLNEAIDTGLKLKLGPVVLSPACASYDMFKNYEERGRVFKNLVHTRAEKLATSV